MDNFALFTIQSRLGLDCSVVGHLHGHLYALCGRFPIERIRFQQQEEPAVRRGSYRHHRSPRFVLSVDTLITDRRLIR